MQNYKYSHFVHVSTSPSISRYEIGSVSEPLRTYAILRKSGQTTTINAHQRSSLTHFYVYERASHKNDVIIYNDYRLYKKNAHQRSPLTHFYVYERASHKNDVIIYNDYRLYKKN